MRIMLKEAGDIERQPVKEMKQVERTIAIRQRTVYNPKVFKRLF
jgi:hypothetical protein